MINYLIKNQFNKMLDNEMLLEQDRDNFYIKGEQTVNRRMQIYNKFLECGNKFLEYGNKFCTFKVCVIIMLLVIIFLSSSTLHYISTINEMVREYVPEFKKDLDNVIIRFNEDSDQIQNVSYIINSEEFQNSYHKINQFVNIISVEDLNKINTLLDNINPEEVGKLIHKLCQLYGC